METASGVQAQAAAGLLAGAWLAQTSHRGFPTQNAPVHQGIAFSKPWNAKGLPDPLYDFRVRPRCSGKERDAETGLDYFGARYFASAQGRWTSPDWSAKPQAVPYADLEDPQSLNLYSYATDRPLMLVDTDGHELFVSANLQATVSTMRQQSPSFNAELAAHEGSASPNLTVRSGATPADPDGQQTTGNTNAQISVTGVEPMEAPFQDWDDGVQYGGYKGATVTINDSIMGDTAQVEGTMAHEVGHVHDARTNTDQYGKQSQYTKQTKGATPHDSRQEEKTANKFKAKVKQERDEFKKEQKREKKEQHLREKEQNGS